MASIPDRMMAAVIDGKKRVELRELSIPELKAGELLIRIEYCLLCTWEQRIYTGESSTGLPFIAGHEASGVVVKVSGASKASEANPGVPVNFKVGDRVVFKTLDHCGHCSYCYQGYTNQCTGAAKKRSYDGIPGSGGLAQYIALEAGRVFPLSGDISLEEAAFTEPLACCIHSVKRSGIEFGDNVVIVGCGIMGQLHSLLCRLKGARVIVVEPRQDRRELAARLGAHLVIDPGRGEMIDQVFKLTGGEGVDVVFNTAANPDIAKRSMALLKKMGRMIFYGSFHPNKNIEIDPNQVHYSEIVITGSSGPATGDFYQASRMLSYKLLPVKDFIYKIFDLSEINEAFEAALSPQSYRVAVRL